MISFRFFFLLFPEAADDWLEALFAVLSFFRSSKSCCFICCFSSFTCLFALLRASVCSFFNCRDSNLRIRMSSRACLRIPRFVEVSNCRRSFFLIAEDSFVASSEDICEQFSSEEDSAGCFGCRLRFLVFGSLLRGFFIRYFFFGSGCTSIR